MKKSETVKIVLKAVALTLVVLLLGMFLTYMAETDARKYNDGVCKKCGGLLEETKRYVSGGASYTTYHCMNCSYQCTVRDSRID